MLGVFSSSEVDLAPPFFFDAAGWRQKQRDEIHSKRLFIFQTIDSWLGTLLMDRFHLEILKKKNTKSGFNILFLTDFRRTAWSSATTLSTIAASSSLCKQTRRESRTEWVFNRVQGVPAQALNLYHDSQSVTWYEIMRKINNSPLYYPQLVTLVSQTLHRGANAFHLIMFKRIKQYNFLILHNIDHCWSSVLQL